MNSFMIKRLVYKDWYFQRFALAASLAGGLLAVGLMSIKSDAAFYAATVLMLTVMIFIGVHLAIVTVVEERTNQTLPFVMSLPISPIDYTIAKIIANLSIFLVPWATLSFGTLALFAIGAPGMIPLGAVTLAELLASYCLVLTVAIVTESQGWTITALVGTNLFLQAYLYLAFRTPGITGGIKGKVAAWNSVSVTLLVAELVVAMLLIGLTFLVQRRKRDFL
jgi:ABC-2 type transport system permease protein